MLKLVGRLREGFQDRQLLGVVLCVVQLQLVGETLRFLGCQDFGVEFTAHQDDSLILELGVVDDVEAFGSVLFVDLEVDSVRYC